MEVDGVPFIGFKNMEQLSEASVEENFDTLYRLKQRYPDKLIISSIMGRTDDEWTRLAQYSTQAGADIIECNFSCPQMTQEGMGSDVGQSPELVRRFTAATRRGKPCALSLSGSYMSWRAILLPARCLSAG